MSFFDLPHVFVVFQPGCGGNFITGLCHKLINGQLDQIAVASSGSSHTQADKKAQGTDFLAFTTLTADHALFSSEQERIDYYLDNIRINYADVTMPQVSWTHDYTNIPVYRKYFKNSKILVITASTEREQFTAVIMQILKTVLDQTAIIPLTQSQWDHTITFWRNYCRPELARIVDSSRVDVMLDDRFNPDYKDVLVVASTRQFLKYYGMMGIIDDQFEKTTGRTTRFGNVLYPSINPKFPYRVGPKIEEFIDVDCAVLPYSYLANNDLMLLSESLESILERALTAEEQLFVSSEFTKYRSAQDQSLLADPKQYFVDMTEKVRHSINNTNT